MDMTYTCSNTFPLLVSCNLKKSLAKDFTSLANECLDTSNNAKLTMLTDFYLNASATILALPV